MPQFTYDKLPGWKQTFEDLGDIQEQLVVMLAAMICSAAACNPGMWYSEIETNFDLGEEPTVLQIVHDRAVKAYKAAYRKLPTLKVGDPLIDAEAEAMLLNGEI